MKTIWKFEFYVQDEATIPMPKGAKVLHVGTQRPMHITLWAVVDDSAEEIPRTFQVRGIGHPLREVGVYIGTVMDGEFVWHVFGVANEKR